MTHTLELLDKAAIRSALQGYPHPQPELEILDEVDSTNLYLMRKISQDLANGHACLAESQTAGRGQRGRSWVSPRAANIYLSVYWHFPAPPESPPCALPRSSPLAGLSLALGVAVARMLTALGVTGTGLKWPNDVLWQGRKLAGILVDARCKAEGSWDVVAGVGLNVAMPDDRAQCPAPFMDQPWADLQGIPGITPSRNECAAALLQQLWIALAEFQARGLPGFLPEWNSLDIFAGRLVSLHTPARTLQGRALGVDATGAFLLRADGKTHRFETGEIRVRLAEALAVP